MSWIDKILPSKIRTESEDAKKTEIPEGVWNQCPSCHITLYQPELIKNLFVCPECGHHFRIGARYRLQLLFDQNSAVEFADNVTPVDALKFKDTKAYKDRLAGAQKKTNEKDALIAMRGRVCDVDLIATAFEFKFLGGSMGSVVGERFVRAVNQAIEHHLPLVCFTASGGARMQESLLSLMQMVKVSAALAKLREKGLPFIVVLTDPTTGGVSASLAMLGDIHLAEPKALIGFAGPRVIEQTVREKLPEGFQRSEFLVEKGMVDMIVPRAQMRETLARVLSKFNY